MGVACWLLCTVCFYVLFVVPVMFAVCCLLFVGRCSLCVVCCSLIIDRCLLSVMCCLFLWCLLFAVLYLLFIVVCRSSLRVVRCSL